jgi:hypothetical protein
MGPHHRWAPGTLFDNITGRAVVCADRQVFGFRPRMGRFAIMFWNCKVNKIIIRRHNRTTKTGQLAVLPLLYQRGSMGYTTKGIVESPNNPLRLYRVCLSVSLTKVKNLGEPL